jgi:MFS family permease
MLTEALTVPLWAKVGPRLGRTTCVQIGILIALVPTVLTGFCTAAWQVVLCRLCSESRFEDR